MKRAMILAATLLALAACSTTHRLLAPDHEAKNVSREKPRNPSRTDADPVCGATMNGTDTSWRSTYQGTTYYFDSEECKRQFEENPDLFTASVR